jgi:hypothetical protein
MAATLVFGIPSLIATGHYKHTPWWAYAGLAVAAILLLVSLFLFFVAPRLSRRSRRLKEDGSDSPRSVSLLGGTVGGSSQFDLDTSADRVWEGTQLGDHARMTVRHEPGRPDLLGNPIGSGRGQGKPLETGAEAAAAGSGEPETAAPEDGNSDEDLSDCD